MQSLISEAKQSELNHFRVKLSEAIEADKKVADMPTIRVTYKQVINKPDQEIFRRKNSANK